MNPNFRSADSVEEQRPALIFVHGFLDGAAAWDDVVEALGATAADALCVDLAGMGARANEAGPFNLDRFADDVITQIERLARPIVIIGQSMGAQVAELVAGRLSPVTRGLVLLTPVPLQGTGLPAESMQPFQELGGNPTAQRALRRQLSVNLDAVRLEKLGMLGDKMEPSRVGEFAELWNCGHSLGAWASAYRGPTLIVRGEGDAFVTDQMISDAILPRFHNPTLLSVPEAGHWPHVEQPAAFAKLLDEFLSDISPASAPH